MISHIRIISPSGVIAPQFIDQAAAHLRAWGYDVSEGTSARNVWGRFAGTDLERTADLIEAIEDPSVDLILCARGGYGLQHIIDKLPPINKPILGFSDVTVLHSLASLNQQPTLHGAMCKHIATLLETDEPILYLQKALHGDELHFHFTTHELNRLGKVTAPIIGGNLSVLYGLQDTPYGLASAIKANPKPILLIEDICEQHYHIDRMMHNLRLSGVLEQISGLIVGQFTDCENDSSMHATIEQTIYGAVASYNYPVLFNAPFGHIPSNLPLWFHTPATLHITADSASLTIPSPCLEH